MGSDKLIGVVEGFYGQPWSDEARVDYIKFFEDNGFNFYLYAPKADPYLRKKWDIPIPNKQFANLNKLINMYKKESIKFGVGFSPFGLFNNFDNNKKIALKDKLGQLNKLNLDVLSIQFDDMPKGDINDLAKRQVEIILFIINLSNAKRFLFCPTFYSFSESLEKRFGKKPINYFKELSLMLPKSIDILWTGPKVCSEEISLEHLKEVELLLGRKPFIWDNLYANDSPNKCKFLNIGPIKGRYFDIINLSSGYIVNPMNEPYLSQIPLMTLREFIKKGEIYNASDSFEKVVEELLGKKYVETLNKLQKIFKEKGLDGISEEEKNEYRAIFSDNSNIAKEIVDWLDGKYIVNESIFD